MKWLLVLLYTHAADPRTEVAFVDPASPSLSAVASFEHLPDASPKGALVPNSRALLVNVERANLRDRSFAASLLRVEPGKPAVELCDRVVQASRPLVSPTGRVFVERGKAGVENEGVPRVDELTIDEVLGPNMTRVIFRARGLATHLAGYWGNEVIVYVKRADTTALVAIDPDGGRERVVARDLAPFARDFSLDGNAIVFSNRAEGGWAVERIDLASEARTRLATSDDQRLAPMVWNGDVVYHARGRMLRVHGGPLLDGTLWMRAPSPDGIMAALRYGEELPRPVLVEKSGKVRQIAAPPLLHFDVVGWTR